MSQQQQPRRSQTDQQEQAVTYGDVFNLSGEIATKPVAPKDAAAMQAEENRVLGQTSRRSAAAVMQSAATINEKRGVVGHEDSTDVLRGQGFTVTENQEGGTRVITETIGDQVVGQFTQPATGKGRNPTGVLDDDAITIGEALEAAALSPGDKPVDVIDAAAIQAAEVRATMAHAVAPGMVSPGGIAATAQSAASHNLQAASYDEKTKLGDILADAKLKMPFDKPVTVEDADCVIAAELRNNPTMATHPGGVAESLAAAAKTNTQ